MGTWLWNYEHVLLLYIFVFDFKTRVLCQIKFVHYVIHAAGLSEDVVAAEYSDDFEDEDELAEVVSCARNAMQTLSGGDSIELKDSGGPSVTVKTLREKYIGQ